MTESLTESTERNEGGAVVDSISLRPSFIRPNYEEVYDEVHDACHVGRTFEGTAFHYLIVFSPYREKYEKNKNYFESKRFIDSIIKFISRYEDAEYAVVTREIHATMIHGNCQIITRTPITKLKGSYNGKFGFHVETHVDASLADRERTLAYILKEARDRNFKYYLDYWYYADVYVKHDVSSSEEEGEPFNGGKNIFIKRVT